LKIIDRLERALREEPDAAGAALVYADAIGNERGEHIVLAHLEHPTREQQQRERELRRAAEKALLAMTKAPDSGRRNFARLTWRRGFVDRIDVDLRGPDAGARLVALLARPELIRLRAIDLRPNWSIRPAEIDIAWLAGALAKSPIRWLGVGSLDTPLDLDTVRALKLPGLALAGTNLDPTFIASLAVADLELAGTGFAAFTEETIEATSSLSLDRLVLFGDPDRSILPRFDKLPRQFGLMGGDDAFNHAFVEWLAEGDRLARLESVGFTVQRNDGSNRWLVENKHRFEHVRFFTGPRWDGGWAYAWHDLGHLYEAMGRTAEALAEFESLVTFDDDATYWADVGMQLATLARRDEALAAHDLALEIDDKNRRAWSGRACVLEDQERFAEAIVAWDRGQAAGLTDVHTWTHRAYTLMRLDRNDEALDALDAALALDPTHEWSKTNRKKLARTPKTLVARARKWLKGA